MHMRHQGNQNLILFEPEIEATIHRQSGTRRRQKVEVAMAAWENKVLLGYALSQASGVSLSITNLVIEVNNLELQPALVMIIEIG